MRFAVISDAPFLVSGGKAIPVDISGNSVRYYGEEAFDYEGPAGLSLSEVHAKFGAEFKRKKRRKKAE